MSATDSNDRDEWWNCPDCGADTSVEKLDGGAARRECSECSWSCRIPSASEVRERY